MEVFQPGSAAEADFLIRNYYNSPNTSYFRLSDNPHQIELPLSKGKGIVVQNKGADTTIITAGPILEYVIQACENLNVNILYFHTLKPFDSNLIEEYSQTRLKVVQDAHGLFETVCEATSSPIEKLGLPDKFCCCYGTIDDVRKHAGLDVESIKKFALK